MTIFAPNEVVAESRFWYHLNQLQKIKKAHGQTVSIQKVVEDEATVQNFGIQIRYRDHIGHHNMYREVRETSASRAMGKMFAEMAGQYHIRYQDIQVIKFEAIKNTEDLKRTKTINMIQTEEHQVKFPHPFAAATIKRTAKPARFAKKVQKAQF